jgi:hypothetical protein
MPSMFRKKTPAEQAAAGDVAPPDPEPDAGLPDRFIAGPPSAQNAIDLFDQHWISSLPPILGLHAGSLPLFDDSRIKVLLAHIDSVKNSKILELAPLEGGHTFMLHEAGARVTAVEARSHAYLKCLVVKEILNLNRAHFYLGDYRAYLASTTDRYDMVLASGVLHEQPDPVALLEAIAMVTDRVAIWTHYWDDRLLSDGALGSVVDATARETPCRGRLVKVHPIRSKGAASDDTTIFASWLERDALLTALTTLGLGRISVLDDQPDHPAGPAILLLAER